MKPPASIRSDRGFSLSDAFFLSVNFNTYAGSVHFVVMVVAVALVHVEARPTGYALAFTEAFVTHLAAHTIRVGGHRQQSCKQSKCSGAEKHRPHFFLLIFLPAHNAFCDFLFRSWKFSKWPPCIKSRHDGALRERRLIQRV